LPGVSVYPCRASLLATSPTFAARALSIFRRHGLQGLTLVHCQLNLSVMCHRVN
jgi:hypothetical protein